jgi:hypothetical protein
MLHGDSSLASISLPTTTIQIGETDSELYTPLLTASVVEQFECALLRHPDLNS